MQISVVPDPWWTALYECELQLGLQLSYQLSMRSCPRTRDYLARRTAEGKTPREIRRTLKRYITRELYQALTVA